MRTYLRDRTLVAAFIDKYKSHGYPIDGAVLSKIGVPYTQISGEAEKTLCDLHEKCVDLLDIDDEEDEGAIILTKDEYIFRMGDKFQEAGKFSACKPNQVASPTGAAAATAASND
ncbi:MAG TPA: hypothetical protein VEI26_10990 [Terriglobales bacterium]|nr:hypothetical protein [Terriglobales bacterium]